MKRTIAFIILLVSLCLTHGAAEQSIPKLHQRITDFTNTLTYQEWKMLEKIRKEYEDSTSTQIVVLLINSLENESIEEYAYKVFRDNQIGQQGKNNGVLLVIAKDDRKMKIEVGYGLEGVLTDAVASRIIRNDIIPHFTQENYFAGLVTGIDAIMRATAGEYKSEQQPSYTTSSVALALLLFVIGVVVLASFFSSRRRHIIGGGRSLYYSGWGIGGWSSRGFGGSGGGGWRGGGGFSGGGGATGSW